MPIIICQKYKICIQHLLFAANKGKSVEMNDCAARTAVTLLRQSKENFKSRQFAAIKGESGQLTVCSNQKRNRKRFLKNWQLIK